jgi:DNA polymerase
MTSRRDAVLREMGLGPIWRLRSSVEEETLARPDAGAAEHVESVAPVTTGLEHHDRSVADAPLATRTAPPAHVAEPVPPATAPSRSRAGPEDRPRTVKPTKVVAMPDPARSERVATLDWASLEADMRACAACVLCERRKQAVPGVGDRQASWMFVGEGPGSEEDQRGEPFVGQAGKLLDAMLAAIGLQRGEDVYIANAVKCRPPHNRTPAPEEIGSCRPYLERQIALVRPTVLVALGRPAALALLESEVSIGAARGRSFDYKGIPVVVTYHPAYLLRNPQDKGKAWADLCLARRIVAERKKGAANS